MVSWINQVFASVLHYEKRSGFLSSLDACDRIRTQDVVSLNPASHASEAIYQLNFSKCLSIMQSCNFLVTHIHTLRTRDYWLLRIGLAVFNY